MNDNITNPVDLLPWDEIQEISEKGLFEEVFKKIPKHSFKFAAEEENRPALIKSAFRSLKKTNPNASWGQATLLADIMQTYARKALER